MEDKTEILSDSPEQTERLGRALASLLPRGGVVALRGDLATGKTCLVRGMASHFAPHADVHSPTFALVNEYGGREGLYHLDLYRLGGLEDLIDVGYEDLFEPDGVCVIEWAERCWDFLPPRRLDVNLEHAGDDARRMVFHNRCLLPEGWRGKLGEA